MDKGLIFKTLLDVAHSKGYRVSFVPFQAYNGRVQGDRIGIRIDLSIEDINYVLTHELAHIHLHTGNLLGSDIEKECEIQADKAANMVLDVLQSV